MKITLFSQILALIDRNLFSRIVEQHQSDKHSKGINSWTQLVSMLFMHFANTQSNRDISNGLRSATGDLNHLGHLKKNVLTAEEISLLVKTDCNNPEVKRAFLFACYTGLGVAEKRKLTRERFVDGKLRLYREKNGQPISVRPPSICFELNQPSSR